MSVSASGRLASEVTADCGVLSGPEELLLLAGWPESDLLNVV